MSGNLERSWARAWHAIGGKGDGLETMERLLACYREPWRHYHTLQHLAECVEELEPILGLAAAPGEVEVALWFHDAVYQVDRHDNEAASALWAKQVLLDAGVGAPAAEHVHDLIMVTRHREPPATPDQGLLVDVDLSILAAPTERFDEYEQQVRREYAHIPEQLFKQGRRAIMVGFLERERIFYSDPFHLAHEAAARKNLRRSISRLGAYSVERGHP
jgi:predicted metal-dependent HD superfamily phosphohydrolase